MPDQRPAFTRDDLRAGVAAGVLSEAQAATLLTLAQTRAGTRETLPDEDEPFELFRGFAEIFVSVGLILLFSGIGGFAALLGDPILIMAAMAGLCWYFARYFTLKRRMMLPSIVLVTGFAMAALGTAGWIVGRGLHLDSNFTIAGLTVCAAVAAALLAWFRAFRVPFTMFLVGLSGLAAVFIVTGGVTRETLAGDWDKLFDLRGGSGFAFGTLAFGLAAFAGGMAFDMRDPHRLGRMSASGFWLHLLAAPALVNTVALTFYNMGPGRGYVLLALALAIIAALALIVDRRSFLTAGIGYLAILIAFVARQGGEGLSWPWVVLILGALVTALGTYWTELRAALMRALPAFPGKNRLPPYTELS